MAWGWLVLAAVLTARAFFYEWGVEWRETATLPLVITCLVLTLGGWPLLRRAWPAVAFLVFLLPLPPKVNGALAQALQHVATTGTCSVLRLTGLWVVPEGNTILVGRDQLEVAEACNGLSMLMCLTATVVATTILIPMARLEARRPHREHRSDRAGQQYPADCLDFVGVPSVRGRGRGHSHTTRRAG